MQATDTVARPRARSARPTGDSEIDLREQVDVPTPPDDAPVAGPDDGHRPPRWRRPGTLGLILGALALAGALFLVAGPGRGMRSDIDRQRIDVGVQRDLITQQRDITAQQLAITQRQLDLANQQLAEARTTRDLSQRTTEIANEQLELTKRTIALQERLLALAEETLQHVRNIDAKTPQTPTAPIVPK
jgi:hypothetical protein